MDEQLVLTAQTLRLNPHVLRANTMGTAFVVKNPANRKYLTVTAEQWNLLRNFANPATVPDVLRAVILSRTCLPLREYYELVLKALQAGILLVDRQPQGDSHGLARRWLVALGPRLPLILAWVSVAVALVFLATLPFPQPQAWPVGILDLVIGWVLLIAGVSLGQAIAASILRGDGGEVYSPKFNLWRPVPYFEVSLEDACMCDRLTQAGVASARLFPVAATAAVLWWFKPEWGVLHVVALLVMLRPFDGSVPTQLLSTLCRGQVLDTHKDFIFSLNRSWRLKFKAGVARVSPGYVAARLAWGLFWVMLVFLAIQRALNLPFNDFFNVRWQLPLLIFSTIVGAALLAYLGPPLVRHLYRRCVGYYESNHLTWKRWRLNSVAPVEEDKIVRLMADSLLFRRMPPAERAALSSCGQTRFYKAWNIIHRFADTSKYVNVILSGRVVVSRRTKSGRVERAMKLKEGDVFGAHALLDPERQQVQIRALTPVLVLAIPIRDFERYAVTPIGVPLADNLAQKAPFLRELSFCAHWHPQAVARFTQIASMVRYNGGELIVAERQDSQQFFLIYEGRVGIRRGGRVRSRLRLGAFFGEISLLQNSAAGSDVVALEETRCLTISKSDFLRFMTHNPHVAIELEDISSKRLGRPVFPCENRTF